MILNKPCVFRWTIDRDAFDRLAAQAARDEYDDVDEYLQHLVNWEASAQGDPVPFARDTPDEEVLPMIAEGFRDVMLGRVLTEAEFWEALGLEGRNVEKTQL